ETAEALGERVDVLHPIRFRVEEEQRVARFLEQRLGQIFRSRVPHHGYGLLLSAVPPPGAGRRGSFWSLHPPAQVCKWPAGSPQVPKTPPGALLRSPLSGLQRAPARLRNPGRGG